MKINKEVKIIKQEVTTYIAEDGEVFSKESDCLKHEKELKHDYLIKQAEKLKVKELDGIIPLNNNELPIECNNFKWYKLNTKEDFEIVSKAYMNGCLYEPKCFPELYCVETCEDETYEGDSYSYNLSDCKESTIEFWKNIGYEVTFTKIER